MGKPPLYLGLVRQARCLFHVEEGREKEISDFVSQHRGRKPAKIPLHPCPQIPTKLLNMPLSVGKFRHNPI